MFGLDLNLNAPSVLSSSYVDDKWIGFSGETTQIQKLLDVKILFSLRYLKKSCGIGDFFCQIKVLKSHEDTVLGYKNILATICVVVYDDMNMGDNMDEIYIVFFINFKH